MKSYVLTSSDANTEWATVDDVTLTKGGDPVELTDEQAQRLRDAGCRLREAAELDELKREQLDERAREAGVQAPEKLPNKQAVIDAIAALQTS